MPKSMLTPAIKDMLDEAVRAELSASNLYLHVANQLQRLGFFGAQKFFLSESESERGHYQIIANYQNDSGTVAKVLAIPAMDEPVKTLRDALQTAYDTECQLERDYIRWYSACSKDPVTAEFLLQFLRGQRKSVGEYGDLLARLDLAGDDRSAILMIDNELGK
jgi:ferritin